MHFNRRSRLSEGYRTIRTNIKFAEWNHRLHVVAVTSTQAGEGKSTTASNLATAYAQEGKRVLLVDGDLRKPSLHEIFGVSNRMGLSNLLANHCLVKDTVLNTMVDNLSLITAGQTPPNPAELLSSGRLSELMEEWKECYDMILIDTSPVMAVADGLIISSHCDGAILVIRAGKVKREYIRKSKEKLEQARANVIGVVLNNKRIYKSEARYYNYYGS